MRVKLILLITALLLLVGCDHGSKHWAESSLKNANHVELVSGVLDLRYAANHDTAFSLTRGRVPDTIKRPALLIMGTIGLVAIAALWRRRRHARLREQAAYLLMMAGAIGNVGDRIVRGYVVDFIHLHHWPIFNVADVLLVAGSLLLLLSWPGSEEQPTRPAPA
jgi:signal peptidase II